MYTSVDQLRKRYQTMSVNWKKILHSKTVEHDRRIDGVMEYVYDNGMKISYTTDKFSWIDSRANPGHHSS